MKKNNFAFRRTSYLILIRYNFKNYFLFSEDHKNKLLIAGKQKGKNSKLTTMSGNNITKESHFEHCDRIYAISIIGWNVFSIGVVCNALLLYFVVKKLAAGKRNDKLFLMNIIAANFVSLFGSLLAEILNRRKTTSVPFQAYTFYFHMLNFLSLFTNLISMSALCYDRYENVTKFPGQRRLSFGKSVKLVAFSWILPIVLIPIAASALIKTCLLHAHKCKIYNKVVTTWHLISFASLIVLVTLAIVVNSLAILRFPWEIYSKLKRHRKETENILGATRTAKEVNLKKQAVAIALSYYVCWIPLVVAAGLVAAKIIQFQSCIYFGCLVATHGSTISTPLLYMTVDKRFRFNQ